MHNPHPLRPNRLQACLLAITAISYAAGWWADNLAHATGLWTLTIGAWIGVIATGNVGYLARRIARVVQLECEQLDTLRAIPDDGTQERDQR